jgi:hypothetical protein
LGELAAKEFEWGIGIWGRIAEFGDEFAEVVEASEEFEVFEGLLSLGVVAFELEGGMIWGGGGGRAFSWGGTEQSGGEAEEM